MRLYEPSAGLRLDRAECRRQSRSEMVVVQRVRKDIITQDKGSNRGGGVRGMSVGLNGRNGEGGQRLGKGANLYWRFFYVSHIGWEGAMNWRPTKNAKAGQENVAMKDWSCQARHHHMVRMPRPLSLGPRASEKCTSFRRRRFPLLSLLLLP